MKNMAPTIREAKRDVNTMGDAPEKSEKSAFKRLFGLFGRIVFVAVLVVALILAVFNWDKLAPDRIGGWIGDVFAQGGKGNGYPYMMNAGNVISVENMSSQVAVLTDTTLLILNSTAKEVAKRPHELYKPFMKTNKERVLLYEQGGNRVCVESRSGNLFEKTFEESILTCAIGKTGEFAVATRSQKATSEMKVYSKTFKEILTWYLPKGNIIDIAISPDGKSAAIITVEASQGELKSTLYVLDFTSDQPVATFEYANTMLLRVVYSDSGTISAFSDTFVTSIQDKVTRLDNISFNHASLLSYSISDGSLALLLSNYKATGNAAVLALKNDGTIAFQTDISEVVRDIDYDGETTAVLCDNKMYYLDENGNRIKEIPLENEVKKIRMSSSYVYALTLGGLERYDLR